MTSSEQRNLKFFRVKVLGCGVGALNVAHYQSKFGELPLDEKLAMISTDKPNEEQLQLMANGMEILVGVLGNVVVGIGQPKH